MKTIAKAVAGTLLAAGAVMVPLSVEAAAAPAAVSVTAVAPSFHAGSHHAYGYRHAGDWRRYRDDDRYDRYDRWGYRNHCRDGRYYGWDRYWYRNHHGAFYWDRY